MRHTLAFLLFFNWILPAIGQNVNDACSQYYRLIEKAHELLRQNQHIDAINKLSAAREHCPARSAEIDRELEVVVTDLKKKMVQMENALQTAETAKQIAEQERQNAERERLKTEQLRIQQAVLLDTAIYERRRAEAASHKADSLAANGQRLAATLNLSETEPTFNFFYRKGQEYFAYSPNTGRRDYYQARIYFAMARFLNPLPQLDSLLRCIQLCQQADEIFYRGELDTAISRYNAIISILKEAGTKSDYEQNQLARVKDLKKECARLKVEYDKKNQNELTLDGDWWPVPTEFARWNNLKTLKIVNNTKISNQLPYVVSQLKYLTHLTFQNCPNLTTIANLNMALSLRYLELKGNAKLIDLGSLRDLRCLENLIIVDNSSLSNLNFLRGLESVRTLKITNNLILSDIDLTTLSKLKELEIRLNVNLIRVVGNELYDSIQWIELSSNPGLTEIKGFSVLPTLTSLYLAGNSSLHSLDNFEEMPLLEVVNINSNNQLTQVLDWRKYPHLKAIELYDNDRIRDLGNKRAIQKIKKRFIFDNDRATPIEWSIMFGRHGLGLFQNPSFKDLNFPSLYEATLYLERQFLLAGFGYSWLDKGYNLEAPISNSHWDATVIRLDVNAGETYIDSLVIKGTEDLRANYLNFYLGLNLNGTSAAGYGGAFTVGLFYKVLLNGSVNAQIGETSYFKKFKQEGDIGIWARLRIAHSFRFFTPFASLGVFVGGLSDPIDETTFYSSDSQKFQQIQLPPEEFPKYTVKYTPSLFPASWDFTVGVLFPVHRYRKSQPLQSSHPRYFM